MPQENGKEEEKSSLSPQEEVKSTPEAPDYKKAD